MSTHALASLFSPTSVAIVGISETRTQGRKALQNLRQGGYRGEIFLVHPTTRSFEGREVYPTLDDLPIVPECVLLAISADKAVSELKKAARLGVKSAVLYASGFSELDAKGQAMEEELRRTAQEADMVLCGPNCMGLVDFRSGFSGYSGSWIENTRPGRVAVLSHSGSGVVVIGNSQRFGIGRLVSVGNAAVLDIADYLDFLADDPQTKVAAIVIETLRDPVAFRNAALKMRRAGKQIVALKNGRSVKGALATAAHTGAVAGPHAAYAEFFRDCGVLTVGDLDELIEVTALLEALGRRPAVGGAGIIGISGGEMTMACDIAEEVGLPLAELSDETKRKIERLMPMFAYASNPLDAKTFDPDVYRDLICALVSDPNVGLVAVAQDSSITLSDLQASTYAPIGASVFEASKLTDKPLVFYNNTKERIHPLIASQLEAAGVPILQGARNALLAMARVLQQTSQQEREWHRPERKAAVADPKWTARLNSPEPLTEREAKELLSAFGLPVTTERLARTADECVVIASTIGFPVVLKIESPDIAHKTEAGGVRLGVNSPEEAHAAFNDLIASVAKKVPAARINGVVVQEMVAPGVEVLVGLSRQDPFGMTMTIGWGGVQVELMNDAQLLLLPCTADEVNRKLGMTKVSKLLDGYRGAAPADKSALIELCLRLSEIAMVYGDHIDAIDLNPVCVLANGKGVRILDAFIETSAQRHGLHPNH